jgi:hypothetical protein
MKFIQDYLKWLFTPAESKPTSKLTEEQLERLEITRKKALIKSYLQKRKTYGNQSTSSEEIRSTK